ncbi:HAD-superfamily hydrolase, subfamily IA, variant 1 [Syntrophobotulus glycolicus DSM 8271]|uniref:HAD-superfamily hydrolase, subfamily IA, variant 1 n=1 Tax=Syntrophobotulus glycolicus (strain DSM 8271 / FlGlyR) TaxID=645991 RepID=F0SXY0_SYNGF|nr:HAD-IA family hydrolase [Syntrophobotulus glycolicus]ADY57041.1 HAD-superfamily hydrolase, subfamily IA, variant 1 [Syntrophobotulus glycolicus DSM 8271]
MNIRGCIFDLDGTLLNTLPVCYMGFRSTLLRYTGREYTDQEIRSLFGPSEEGVLKKLLPGDWQEALQHYLDAYEKIHETYTEPFPGIEQLLSLLTERKLRLGIVSGKGPGTMAISLRYSGLGKYFEVVQTGSVSGADKPEQIGKVLDLWKLAPREVAYIGDMAYDMASAKETGVVSIGAVWAETADRKRVLQENPDFIFEKVKHFYGWVEENWRGERRVTKG